MRQLQRASGASFIVCVHHADVSKLQIEVKAWAMQMRCRVTGAGSGDRVPTLPDRGAAGDAGGDRRVNGLPGARSAQLMRPLSKKRCRAKCQAAADRPSLISTGWNRWVSAASNTSLSPNVTPIVPTAYNAATN